MKVIVVLDRLRHREGNQISIRFVKDWKIASLIKAVPGVLFSRTHSCWYVAETAENLTALLKLLRGSAHVDDAALYLKDREKSSFHSDAMRRMTEQLVLKGYSDNTRSTYLDQFNRFLNNFPGDDPAQLTEEQITSYLLRLIRVRKLSRSTQNQAINAIKFYFEHVLHQSPKVYRLERPLKQKALPVVLNEEEIHLLFNSVDNIKHKLILMILYSAGLRRSELLNLRLGDLDFERGVVFVRGGKGRKDRQSVLSRQLKPLVDHYLEEYRPQELLFEGLDKQPYSATSLQAILRKGLKRAGLKKHIKLHSLRHSFATHLLEAGTSTRYIQTLLGHESSRTTEIYTHVANFGVDRVKSPLDNIRLGQPRATAKVEQ